MIVINDLVVGELSAIVAHYETALADNDVEVMRMHFWGSGETVCFDPSGEQHGHDVIAATASTTVMSTVELASNLGHVLWAFSPDTAFLPTS